MSELDSETAALTQHDARGAVFNLIHSERKYQIESGKANYKTIGEWLLVMEAELAEAKIGWIKGYSGRNDPLHEILQIAAVATACLEQYIHEIGEKIQS